jgi:hypothetical protein
MYMNGEHKTVLMRVNADIDEQMVPLVTMFNSNPRIRTLSCCQGNPRVVDEIMKDAWLAFRLDSSYEYAQLCEFCFSVLEPLLWKTPADFPVEAHITIEGRQGNYIARLYLINQEIAKVTELLKPAFKEYKG